jgi:lipopolysaccharide transport system ATP-binding protein
MSSDIAIKVENLSKCYHIYERPQDRLKQSIYPKIQRMIGKKPGRFYQEFWALKDISFKLKKGEILGIIGCNGSGKSTLLQIICGTLNPTYGNIEANGRISALLELGSGFNPEFTGRENVYLNGSVLGISQEEIADRFDAIVAFADIGAFIDQPVKTYSSGMMLRLAFAVAVNVDPQILVVDEALSVGDELFQRKCFSHIETLKKKGVTILFVSHSAATVIELCSQAMLLDAGEKLTFGMPKPIVGRYQRLLYAPKDKRELIREEIRNSIGCIQDNTKSCIQAVGQVINKNDATSEMTEVEEFYDENLVSQSTIEYESMGARISEPEILSRAGDRINVLRRGKSYIYTYKVHFDRGATNVRFAMRFKTTTGVILGGMLTASDLSPNVSYVAPGSTIKVEVRFDCMLNPGCYYINSAVQGVIDTAEIVIHRILDAYVFRVAHDADTTSAGSVYFNCVTDVALLEVVT